MELELESEVQRFYENWGAQYSDNAMRWMNEESCFLAQAKGLSFPKCPHLLGACQAYGCLGITHDFSAGKQSDHMADH